MNPNPVPPPKRLSKWTSIAFLSIWVLGAILLAVVLIPLFIKSNIAAKTTVSVSTLKRIGVAASLYSLDHDQSFPPAGGWELRIASYDSRPAELFDPQNRRSPSDAYSRQMASVRQPEVEIPDQVPLFFESTLPGPSAVGGPDSLFRDSSGRLFICFADTHVKAQEASRTLLLLWNPRTAPVRGIDPTRGIHEPPTERRETPQPLRQ